MSELKYVPFKVIIKPTLLFFSANIFAYTFHELSHALTAYFLNIDSTLFHFYVRFTSNATPSEGMIIAAAGPIMSLCFGILSWAVYKKSQSVTLKLFMLYHATFCISIFLGNIFSTAFAGDFRRVSILAGIPVLARWIFTFIGLILITLFMYRVGKELLEFKPLSVKNKSTSVFITILLPWILGTALIIITYLPLPNDYVIGMISSSFFWIFSLIPSLRNKTEHRLVTFLTVVNIIDVILVLVSIIIVRYLINGIFFNS